MQVSSRTAVSQLERAGNWFLHSGIVEANGGVARYYRMDGAANARVSTEITGYAVSTFVYLYEVTGRQEYLDSAMRAARFLADIAWNNAQSTIAFEYPAEAGRPEFTYFFDCGIIARGLLGLHRVTGASQWLEAAVRVGKTMKDFVQADTIAPILELPSKTVLPFERQWSRSPGCYQLKSAVTWREMQSEIEGASELWETALQAALAGYRTFLPAENNAKTMDRLHAFCYFLEALLQEPGRAECRAAVGEGIGLVSGYLRAIRSEFVRSDVYAQLLRIRLWADAAGICPLDHAQAQEEADALPRFIAEAGGNAGGCIFGLKNVCEPLPFMNPVSTAFTLQALQMWHEYQDGQLVTDTSALI